MAKADSRVDKYQDLLEEHVKLRGLLSDLERTLAERSGPIGGVVKRLAELRDLVDTHFAAEEASDCFPDLVSFAPRVCDRVKIMLAEHGELRAEIAQIVQDTEKCLGQLGGLGSAGREFSGIHGQADEPRTNGKRIGPGSVHGRYWLQGLIMTTPVKTVFEPPDAARGRGAVPTKNAERKHAE